VGTDTLIRVLTDNFGNSATSSVSVVVSADAFRFDLSPGATKFTPAGFQLLVDGAPVNNAVVVEASLDLVHWQPILTNTPLNGSFQILDP
jgi:hypothetical protein